MNETPEKVLSAEDGDTLPPFDEPEETPADKQNREDEKDLIPAGV